MNKRTGLGDAAAFHFLGVEYRDEGLASYKKAFELYKRAAELGSAIAHYELGHAYFVGQVVGKDLERGKYHVKLAAIGGHEGARHVLGTMEGNDCNINRAYKHFIIAARSGYDGSLKQIGLGYKGGHVTKDEYANTLRTYKDTIDSMTSRQRTLATEVHKRQENKFN